MGAPTMVPRRTAVVAHFAPLALHAFDHLLMSHALVDQVMGVSCPNEALEVCAATRPEVLITEVDVASEGDGLRLCRKAKQLSPSPRVMVCPTRATVEVLAAASTSGADSVIESRVATSALVEGVRSMMRGDPVWIVPSLRDMGSSGRQTGSSAQGPTASAAKDVAASLRALSKREREVLHLVLLRLSNEEIAARLCLARQTVKNHVSSVLQKLAVPNRAALYASAFADVAAGRPYGCP